MSNKNPIENLASLSERQREVFLLRCDSHDYEAIGEILHIAESTVKSHMATIYIKLELDSLGRDERYLQLRQVYCSLMKGMELPTPPPEESSALIQISSAIMRMVEEDEKASEGTPQPAPIVIRSSPEAIPPSRRGSRLIPLLAIGLFIVLGIALGTLLAVNLIGGESEPSSREISQAGEDTANVSGTEIAQLQSTINALANEEDSTTDLVTAPTSEVIAGTPEADSSVQPSGPTFADDFESAPDSSWRVLYGDIGMANGKYTVLAPYTGSSIQHLVMLDGHEWESVAITVNLPPLGLYTSLCGMRSGDNCGSYGMGGIIVRLEEGGSGVGLLIFPQKEGLALATFDSDGKWTMVAGTLVTGDEKNFDLASQTNEIRIEGYGNTYTAFVNGRKVTSGTISGPSSGRMGLWFQTSDRNNDIGLYTARIEDIQVESIE